MRSFAEKRNSRVYPVIVIIRSPTTVLAQGTPAGAVPSEGEGF
jgi:hypothetical protein